MAVPTDINYRRKSRILALTFGTDAYELSAELLRVYSPSAEVRGHGSADARLQTGKKAVGISDLQPSGNYGLRLVFDDGHDSGIYSWAYLEQLGRDQAQLWAQYLADLKAAGATREPLIARQFNPLDQSGSDQPGSQ